MPANVILPFIIIGVIASALGLVGLLWIGRRAFYRRNIAGLEEFKNYTSAVTTAVFEKTLRVVCIILLGSGLLFIITPILFGEQ
jgi:uncharacterized membrane protein YfbV (UPF0208 family)